jgi:hypothetical protein
VVITGKVRHLFIMCYPTGRATGLWLTLLASSSASSTYVQYVSGTSFSPPRYPLKTKWSETVSIQSLAKVNHEMV